MPTLEIKVVGPLLVAGDASVLGADLSTARRLIDGRSVPYIPATALRGAVRIQLEALLRGAGRGAVGPYPFTGSKVATQPDDAVARLFGYSGPDGEREHAREGQVRFGDALPVDPVRAAEAIRLRPGVEINDQTSAAADQKLFFREVADVGCDLVFHAPVEVDELVTPEDAKHFRAAVEATDALGAGKAKGGGALEIRWVDEGEPIGAVVSGDPATARRARLSITLLEPAHFGDGGPLGNHQATRTYIPGATIRGALAWALIRQDREVANSPAFQELFVSPNAASIGDAILVEGAGSEAFILPATRREHRGSAATDDVLVRELARERGERALVGKVDKKGLLALRADDGETRFDPIASARPEAKLLRRTRTRVSIDRESGAAADGRLFSIEQIESTTVAGESACFVSWIEGIPPSGAELLAKLEGLPIAFGAGRNHGLGRAAVELRLETETAIPGGPERVLALSAEIESQVLGLAKRLHLDRSEIGPGSLVLAVVAQSDYVPTSSDAPHPLAEAALTGRLSASMPVRRFLRAGAVGGFDQRPDRPGPLKELLPTIGAGSVFVYDIERASLAELDEILATLRRGVGRRVESGCGRFALHSNPPQESRKKEGVTVMATALSASALVKKAEDLLTKAQEDERLEKVKPKKDQKKVNFWEQTSQLRNLVQITQTETEVPVLINFIRYQQGRRSTREFWTLIADGVVGVLDEIDAVTTGDAVARARWVRNFFGYLVRHYVYVNETKNPKKGHARTGPAAKGWAS